MPLSCFSTASISSVSLLRSLPTEKNRLTCRYASLNELITPVTVMMIILKASITKPIGVRDANNVAENAFATFSIVMYFLILGLMLSANLPSSLPIDLNVLPRFPKTVLVTP